MICLGVIPRLVVKKYSSRWVPVQSWTNTQRTGTKPSPPLYQSPVAVTTATFRRPPPYQATFNRRRRDFATTLVGDGCLAPFFRGRPMFLPRTTGGGAYRVGVGVKQTDQGQSLAMPMDKSSPTDGLQKRHPRQTRIFVGETSAKARPAVAASIPPGFCGVAGAPCSIPGCGTTPPAPATPTDVQAKGNLHQDRQHHPLVAPTICRVGVRRANGVSMTRLAVDFLPAMLVDRIVADQRHPALGEANGP